MINHVQIIGSVTTAFQTNFETLLQIWTMWRRFIVIWCLTAVMNIFIFNEIYHIFVDYKSFITVKL